MTIASPVKLKTATPVPLVAPRMARIAEIQQVALPKVEEGPVLVRTHWRADHRKKESRIFEGKSGFAHLASPTPTQPSRSPWKNSSPPISGLQSDRSS